MNTFFNYSKSPSALRERIAPAHRRAWVTFARPGTWWSGHQRVAIVSEMRRAEGCALCRDRKAALSAAAVAGQHEGDDVLPAAAVEAVHKITTDPGRLSRGWLESLFADGLEDTQYVELVGVVTRALSIDDFHRGLGLPLERLPTPEAGEPERRRPTGAAEEGAWLPTVSPDRLDPADKDLYEDYHFPTPYFAIRALSLVPAEVRHVLDLNNAQFLTRSEFHGELGRTLSHPQILLIGARVSVINECFYCATYSSTFLYEDAKRTEETVDLNGILDPATTTGVPQGDLLVRFSDALVQRDPKIDELRQQLYTELGPGGVFDAVAVVATFQRQVRISNAIGIPLDESIKKMSEAVQAKLGLDQFASCEHSNE